MPEKSKIDINTVYHFHSLLAITWTAALTAQSCCVYLIFFQSLKRKDFCLSLAMYAVELLRYLLPGLCPLLLDQLSQQLP